MKKAITVFVILTPVAFLVWLLSFCLGGVVGPVDSFVEYLQMMVFSFKDLFTGSLTSWHKIASFIVIGILFLALLFYFIFPPVRKRYGYMWHSILAVFASLPLLFTCVNYSYYRTYLNPLTPIGQYILIVFALAATALTSVLMFTLGILTIVDIARNKGRKDGEKVPAVDEFGVQVPVEPVVGENGLSSKAIPGSEPIQEKPNQDLLDEIRRIVREELEMMLSSLQARQSVSNMMVAESIKEKSVPVEPIVEEEPEVIEEEPEVIEEEPAPIEEKEEVKPAEPEVKEVEPDPEVMEDVTPEEEIEVPVFEEEPEAEPEEIAAENPIQEPEVEPEPEPVLQEAPVVEETPVVEEPAPIPEAEIKPTYERISFMDRMINADPEMKEHYNTLKNLIMSYGVKSRVSNSGDAFRLHTKTYVKLTIAGKSLKLYFALDPKDYENTTLPIQDVGHKGIYAEIPLAFKVKSDLSMKRAKDLIADAMAKDSLEQGEVESIDYVERLKDEVAEQDEE